MTITEARARRRKRRAIALAVVIGALALTLAASHLSGWLQWRAFVRDVDRIATTPWDSSTRSVRLLFTYAGQPHLIEFEVPLEEIERSRSVQTAGLFRLSDAARERYFRHLVLAASRSRSVRALADELRLLRLELRLDSDEYLELVTRSIQEIPYGTVRREFLLPAEVLAGHSGVCSDKSILLAALLVHEGYDTALLVLDADGHVAVGVGSDGPTFMNSGYAFVETTAGFYIGQVNNAFRGVGPVPRSPQIVTLTRGRRYGASTEVEVIMRVLRTAQKRSAAFEPYVEYAQWGGMHAARYAVRAYDFSIASEVAAYILENAHDRHGVYVALTNPGPAAAADGSRVPY